MRKIIKKSLLILLLLIYTSCTNISYGNTKKSVFIDVGHRGYDNGSYYNDNAEDSLNLNISQLVAKKLEKYNVKVYLNRQDDAFLSLSERTNMANKSKADLFVSIHQNASEDKEPNGIETIYMNNNKEIAEIFQHNLLEITGANDRGVKSSNLQVLRDNELPAILIECGFLSNPTEGYKLSTFEYQDKLSDAIVKSIKEYLNLELKSDDADIVTNNEPTKSFDLKNIFNDFLSSFIKNN